MFKKMIVILSISLCSFSVTDAYTEEYKANILYYWSMKFCRQLPDIEPAESLAKTGDFAGGIKLLSEHIEDRKLEEWKRMHYLVARSVFSVCIEDIEQCKKDKEHISELINDYSECYFQYGICYRRLYAIILK